MKLSGSAILLLSSALSMLAIAQSTVPTPVSPETLQWVSPPGNPSLQSAWVVGTGRTPGPYLLRVKLAAGARIPPHRHPDERNSTVLAGTIHVGFGETFDESNVVAVPTGGVYVTPANVPHYVWAKDGDAMYQEAGAGTTGTTFVAQ